MLIKAKSLISKTAKDLDLPEEQVKDAIDFYYDELRSNMEDLKESRIRIPGLGVFYISKKKLEQSINTLTGIIETREPANFKEVKIIEKRKDLLKLQKKAFEKLIKENKEHESKKNI